MGQRRPLMAHLDFLLILDAFLYLFLILSSFSGPFVDI